MSLRSACSSALLTTSFTSALFAGFVVAELLALAVAGWLLHPRLNASPSTRKTIALIAAELRIFVPPVLVRGTNFRCTTPPARGPDARANENCGFSLG